MKPDDICKRMKISDNFISCSEQGRKYIKDKKVLKRIEKVEQKIKKISSQRKFSTKKRSKKRNIKKRRKRNRRKRTKARDQ